MLNWLKQLFSDSGTVSMVRVLSFMCVITASLLAFIGIYAANRSLESIAVLCGTFLGAGLGAKVMQKGIESSKASVKEPTSSNKSSNSTFHISTLADNSSESGDNEDKK